MPAVANIIDADAEERGNSRILRGTTTRASLHWIGRQNDATGLPGNRLLFVREWLGTIYPLGIPLDVAMVSSDSDTQLVIVRRSHVENGILDADGLDAITGWNGHGDARLDFGKARSNQHVYTDEHTGKSNETLGDAVIKGAISGPAYPGKSLQAVWGVLWGNLASLRRLIPGQEYHLVTPEQSVALREMAGEQNRKLTAKERRQALLTLATLGAIGADIRTGWFQNLSLYLSNEGYNALHMLGLSSQVGENIVPILLSVVLGAAWFGASWAIVHIGTPDEETAEHAIYADVTGQHIYGPLSDRP